MDGPFKKLDFKQALEYILISDFCNPHQLIRNRRKHNLIRKFFEEIFGELDVYLLNTIKTPEESLNRIKYLAKR